MLDCGTFGAAALRFVDLDDIGRAQQVCDDRRALFLEFALIDVASDQEFFVAPRRIDALFEPSLRLLAAAVGQQQSGDLFRTLRRFACLIKAQGGVHVAGAFRGASEPECELVPQRGAAREVRCRPAGRFGRQRACHGGGRIFGLPQAVCKIEVLQCFLLLGKPRLVGPAVAPGLNQPEVAQRELRQAVLHAAEVEKQQEAGCGSAPLHEQPLGLQRPDECVSVE